MELLTAVQSNATTDQSLEQEQLNALINSMADGFLAVDSNGKIVLSNGAALNILDINSTLANHSIADVIKLFDSEGNPVNFIEQVMTVTTQLVSRDWLLHYTDGSKVHLYVSVAPVHLGYGSNAGSGFVILLRDITREKSLEEERDEFISVVSHELRTPVAIAEAGVSNAQLLAEKHGLQKDITDSLKSTHDQVVFLSNMINDLSTLSRAERGKLELNLEPINVAELVTSLEQDYKPQAKQKGLDFSGHVDPKLEVLNNSKLYVREILQNFVTNAIKYTEEGSVTLSAKQHQNGIRFEVSDTGIGISKADQERVFDKFFRSEDFRTRANNGTGLGLYVTMKLARMVHAEIELTSELNHGTTFSIFIPNIFND